MEIDIIFKIAGNRYLNSGAAQRFKVHGQRGPGQSGSIGRIGHCIIYGD